MKENWTIRGNLPIIILSYDEDCESAKARSNLVSKGSKYHFDPNITSLHNVKKSMDGRIKLRG